MPDLVDTSAWAHRHDVPVQPWFTAQLLLNEIGIVDIVKLEVMHGARSAREFDELREELDSLPAAPVTPGVCERAMDVMQKLAHLSGGPHHRAVKPADLLIAAAAEMQGWTLVHYDSDYEYIGQLTGQPMRWVAERGTL